MKNCGPELHTSFCDKDFLDFVANLARGKKVFYDFNNFNFNREKKIKRKHVN